MSTLTQSPAWGALAAHRGRIAGTSIGEMFTADASRASGMSLEFGKLYLDGSRHLATAETLRLLVALAEQARVTDWTDRMFAGEPINHTENRPALHVALRADRASFQDLRGVLPEVSEVHGRMRALVAQARSGSLLGATGKPARCIVNIGIGGSDLGPRMICRALRARADGPLAVRFVANVDPDDLALALDGLDPQTTFFLITSKTFTTAETLDNALRARRWLRASLPAGADTGAHFFAVTAAAAKAAEFGIAPERIFPIWDWVGGRFSVWSAVGLPIAFMAGMECFDELLAGARDMDAHFRNAPLARNLPVRLALLSVWYVNFWNTQTRAVIPYSEDLRELPAYLQQLEMESNGKRVDREGRLVDYATAPVVWGASGTSSQHSFHQLLHQGTHLVPVDFILVGGGNERDMLTSNGIAQAAALMSGAPTGEAHRSLPGSRPSSTLLLERLSPEALGQLIALYEHKVFVEGVIWNINSFDQWGVEFGKTLARTLLPALAGVSAPEGIDPATRDMIARVRRLR